MISASEKKNKRGEKRRGRRSKFGNIEYIPAGKFLEDHGGEYAKD